VNLQPNLVIRWKADPERLERVLFIRADAGATVVINIVDRKAWPHVYDLDALTSALEIGEAFVADTDPAAHLLKKSDDELTQAERRTRDRRWEIILPLTSDQPYLLATNIHFRGAAVAERSIATGKGKRLIYDALRRYWIGGMTRNALIPSFGNCGNKGKRKAEPTSDSPKRGRPSYEARATGQSTGVNLTADMRRRLSAGIARFLDTRTAPTVREAYKLTLRHYFYKSHSKRDGAIVVVLVPPNRRPTYEQFRSFYYSTRNVAESTRSREGDREYILRHRAVTGTSQGMAVGPGSLYQIDSTIGDIYLVSSLDRNAIIGRPVIYVVLDLFSRMIAGFAVTLEGPSWEGAALALANAFTEKVAFCAEYGEVITPSIWPCSGLPDRIVADRGEIKGWKAESLIDGLGIVVSNTGAFRADWKGAVERSFRRFNEPHSDWIPGAFRKEKKRGGADYRLDATLTPDEFRRLILSEIIEYNQTHHMAWYRRDEFAIADRVERFPLALWNWGVQARTGGTRTCQHDVVAAHLLQPVRVSVTGLGLYANKLYFTSDTAEREGWFDQASAGRVWHLQARYDLCRIDRMYVRLADGTLEACRLLDKESAFLGRDWYEVDDYFTMEKIYANHAVTNGLDATAVGEAKRRRIVKEAKEKQRASRAERGKVSKSEQLANIRENRLRERDLERSRRAGQDAPPAIGASHEEVGEYIALPTDVDRLAALRERIFTEQSEP
jgi:putative transposase